MLGWHVSLMNEWTLWKNLQWTCEGVKEGFFFSFCFLLIKEDLRHLYGFSFFSSGKGKQNLNRRGRKVKHKTRLRFCPYRPSCCPNPPRGSFYRSTVQIPSDNRPIGFPLCFLPATTFSSLLAPAGRKWYPTLPHLDVLYVFWNDWEWLVVVLRRFFSSIKIQFDPLSPGSNLRFLRWKY